MASAVSSIPVLREHRVLRDSWRPPTGRDLADVTGCREPPGRRWKESAASNRLMTTRDVKIAGADAELAPAAFGRDTAFDAEHAERGAECPEKWFCGGSGLSSRSYGIGCWIAEVSSRTVRCLPMTWATSLNSVGPKGSNQLDYFAARGMTQDQKRAAPTFNAT
jgi:hypothetical protein